MKRGMCRGIFWGAILCCVGSSAGTPIEIKHALIGLMDGTPRVQMPKILVLENNLKHLLQGNPKREAPISYKGKRVTLQDLVLEEKSVSIAHSHDLAAALKQGLERFIEVSGPYLNENRGFKRQLCAIIQQWAKQRERPHTQLLDWADLPSDVDEYDQMKKRITSFKKFDEFVSDLLCFLQDLRFSCKQSWKAFVDEYQKTHSTHKEL